MCNDFLRFVFNQISFSRFTAHLTTFITLGLIENMLQIFDMIPTWVWILTTVVLALIIAEDQARISLNNLEAKIDRRTVTCWDRKVKRKQEHLKSVPQAVLNNPAALHHQRCSIHVPNYKASGRSADHFTHLVRYLAYFSGTPGEGYFSGTPGEGYFDCLAEGGHQLPQIDDRIAFAAGERACDLKRGSLSVEISMEHEYNGLVLARLLVMRLDTTDVNRAVLILETLQWLSEGTGKEMPFTQWPVFLLPKTSSAAFLVYGAEFLVKASHALRVEEGKVDDDGFVVLSPVHEVAA
jgi:hypothetical protein